MKPIDDMSSNLSINPTENMNPTVRLLLVMEYLMACDEEPVRQVDIARDLDMSPATVNRMVTTLSNRGYLFRTSDKRCVVNFHLNRNVPMSEAYLKTLDAILQETTSRYRVAAEAVVVSGFDLLWHSKTELPDASVKLRAHAGFRRNLYALDALSRLYLSRIDWDKISYKFNANGFFRAEVDRASLTAEEVRNILREAAKDDFAYDMEGNHVGVRRFATIIEDDDGNFLHLFSIAEAAVPVSNRAEKIETTLAILADVKKRLQSAIKEHGITGRRSELHPPHIG
ncbi:helix-turn-helix domain-containing protein [Marinobacterium rhizophilum]|uniref:Helix-turn-helix domain-containing protein n=1 Tax=Marinobacterium rhizophilum TaxID=420402 RepID=A0ABY5HD40_9GAMM|nr:helix-turn-helix domain-containing protein [Marinobacterium rhizophilum]UTW10242.1 helix-turn-helix domain-containing protein [Marinobacterium rhizophilum]